LASKLFQVDSSSSAVAAMTSEVDPVHALRTELFDTLSRYFPDEMTHPRSNLIDLIPYPADM
jgi:hypothetical protein